MRMNRGHPFPRRRNQRQIFQVAGDVIDPDGEGEQGRAAKIGTLSEEVVIEVIRRLQV
jgi:hypothetical protein